MYTIYFVESSGLVKINFHNFERRIINDANAQQEKEFRVEVNKGNNSLSFADLKRLHANLEAFNAEWHYKWVIIRPLMNRISALLFLMDNSYTLRKRS
jgi:serine protease inhibitor ecotin